MRDDILFGFPPKGDMTSASETLRLGIGQCNTKGTLLLALCQASEIPARLHFGPIRRSIQRGIYTGIWYRLLPTHLSHSWLEVEIDGRWQQVDSFINDEAFSRAAERQLELRGWPEGFSQLRGYSRERTGSGEFMQMGAVEGDDGIFTEPATYYAGTTYRNRVGPLRACLYSRARTGANRRVAALRHSAPAPTPLDSARGG